MATVLFDYDQALAWMYVGHGGPTLVSSVYSIETTYRSSVRHNPPLLLPCICSKSVMS